MSCSEPIHTEIKTTATSKAEGRLMVSAGKERRRKNKYARKVISKISK